jgi:hypothetical protein
MRMRREREMMMVEYLDNCEGFVREQCGSMYETAQGQICHQPRSITELYFLCSLDRLHTISKPG